MTVQGGTRFSFLTKIVNTTLDSLNLDRSEQKALEICGINRLCQLAAASPEQLSRDLAAAERLFPDQPLSISLQRLTDICSAARQALAEADPAGHPMQPDDAVPKAPEQPGHAQTQTATTPQEAPIPSAPSAKTSEPAAEAKPSAPPQRLHSSRRGTGEEFAPAPVSHHRHRTQKGLDNYHAAHPVALVLASLFLLLTLLGALLLIVASVYLMMDEEPPLPAPGIIIGCAVTGVAYLLCLTRCKCVICRGRMCSVFSHKRGRHAHYIPLLGHTIPTAFAILFTLSTVCPHCNTRQSIIGGFRPASRFHHNQH